MIQGGSTTIWGASKILTYEDGDLKAQHVLVPSESMPTPTPLLHEDDKLKRLRQTAKIYQCALLEEPLWRFVPEWVRDFGEWHDPEGPGIRREV